MAFISGVHNAGEGQLSAECQQTNWMLDHYSTFKISSGQVGLCTLLQPAEGPWEDRAPQKEPNPQGRSLSHIRRTSLDVCCHADPNPAPAPKAVMAVRA